MLFKKNKAITEICNLETQLPSLAKVPGPPWKTSSVVTFWGASSPARGGVHGGRGCYPQRVILTPPLNYSLSSVDCALGGERGGLYLCVSENEFGVPHSHPGELRQIPLLSF